MPATDWRSAVLAWVDAHKTYPRAARLRGREGAVMARVTAAADGQVLAVTIEESSGSELLDGAVRRLFEGAHLPAFGAGPSEPPRTLSLRVGFALVDGR